MIAIHLVTEKIATIEVIWTAVCLSGLLFMARPLRRSVKYREVLDKEQVNGIRDYAAFTTILLFSVIEIMLFIFFIAGVLSMLMGSRSTEVRPTTYVTAGLLITGTFVIALAGYVVDKRQHQLEMRIIKEDW